VTIGPGEFVAILGHSGCGKSTVLSIVGGLERATYGGVVIDGKEVRGPGPERAIVFQSPCLLPWLTSRQNVGWRPRRAHRARRRRHAADRYLDLVGVPEAADQVPRAAVARHAAVRFAGARALDGAAVPPARRAVLDARLADALRAAGDAAARVGGLGQDRHDGHARHRRGALPLRPPRADDRRPRGDRRGRAARAVSAAAHARRRARSTRRTTRAAGTSSTFSNTTRTSRGRARSMWCSAHAEAAACPMRNSRQLLDGIRS
jgi:ABC-type sugar transport system ATPase subunit